MKISNQTTPPSDRGQAKQRTPLQKHVDFFDRNCDGFTTVGETYEGLRTLGLGRILSAAGAVFINGGLSHRTGAEGLSLTIHNDNIAAAKHDSDTDVYDEKGNFNQKKFDELWATRDRDGNNELSKSEIDALIEANAETRVGKIASKAEFGLLLKLGGQKNAAGEQVITRERLEQLYDGSLFYRIAADKAKEN